MSDRIARVDRDCRSGDGFIFGCNVRPGAGTQSGAVRLECSKSPTWDAEVSRLLSRVEPGKPMAEEDLDLLTTLRKRGEGLAR